MFDNIEKILVVAVLEETMILQGNVCNSDTDCFLLQNKDQGITSILSYLVSIFQLTSNKRLKVSKTENKGRVWPGINNLGINQPNPDCSQPTQILARVENQLRQQHDVFPISKFQQAKRVHAGHVALHFTRHILCVMYKKKLHLK